MKNPEINPMEGDILTAENVPSEDSPKEKTPAPKHKKRLSLSKIKSITSKFKSLKTQLKTAKFIIALSLLLLIPVIYVGFILLNANSSTSTPASNNITATATPTPPPVNNELQSIQKRIEVFSTELENLETNRDDFVFPEVDLGIQF